MQVLKYKSHKELLQAGNHCICRGKKHLKVPVQYTLYTRIMEKGRPHPCLVVLGIPIEVNGERRACLAAVKFSR